jgi:kynurenine 3-monooxygenase
MHRSKNETITIIGAGLAGCFMGILLAKRGYSVAIYERHAKKDSSSTASNRSFNLTFYGFGVQILKDTGLWKEVVPHVLKLKGSVTQVSQKAKPITAILDGTKMPYYTISRAKMVEILIEKALKEPSITMHFNMSLLSIDKYKKTFTIQNEKTKKITTKPYNIIIGADGVHSLVRYFLQHGQEQTHSQEYASWSYKQVHIPKELVNTLKLQNDFAYTWSRKNAVIASFPIKDGAYAGMLILPKKHGFGALKTKEDIATLINTTFPELLPALPAFTKAIMQNPEGKFVTVHTSPWYYKDSMAVIGDAAHGFYPFFGQGISAAFGDCITLCKLLDAQKGDWNKVLPRFQDARKKHMDTLGELSKEGFIRYRRHAKGDYNVIFDRFESLLHTILPNVFLPSLFTLVSEDPNHTADYTQKMKKQRRAISLFGGSVLVGAVTGVVMMYEKIFTNLKIKKRHYQQFNAHNDAMTH